MEEWRRQFPLRAHGCRLLNQFGQHFKLAGVNWYGASDSFHVVGGLDARPLSELCHAVAAMGFTVVRLPFSSEMLRVERVPPGAIDYVQNKDLEGLSPLQVYDRVIEELGAAGVTVIINNHTTVGAWSGGVELNGMWFRDQCKVYTEQSWIDDWVMMAKRYEDHPEVIGYDIRNEVRPTSMMGPSPRWGNSSPVYDWSRAAGSCARALMDANAPGLVVVERIAWPQNSLREMLNPKPPWEAWQVPRDRIVLAVHMYAWSGPGAWSPKHFMPGVLRSFFDVVDYVGARSLYGEMSQEALEEQMDKDFGFCIDEDICPVWLSELGCSLDTELEWFTKVCQYLDKKDVDFAYWPLNVGPKPGGSDDEAYGILTNDWQPRWADPRLQALRRLCPQAVLPSPKKAQTRRPLQLPARARADSGSLSPFHLNVTPNVTPVASPSCFGQVDEPLWGAPFPWCQPLPGPLVPWPSSTSLKEMPEARYIWKVLEGVDSDPGKDALTVRCDDLEAVKELCIRRHFGGFVLHEGYAYFRLSSPEGLLMRQQPGYPKTVLYVAEEVRLCGMWQAVEPLESFDTPAGSFKASGDVICLPLSDEHPEAALEACQRACLEAQKPGFVMHDFASACLMEPNEAEDLRTRLENGQWKRCSEASDAGIYLLEPKPFYVGVDMFKDMDAFPGSDARVLKGRFGIARCREICIQEGYAGFAIQNGVARFRSAAAAVLRERMVVSKGSVFYILTTREVIPEEGTHATSASLDQVLTKLWSPTQAVVNGSKLQHKVQACDNLTDEEVIHL